MLFEEINRYLQAQNLIFREWSFGMKLHIAVDDVLGWIHRLGTTPATATAIHNALIRNPR